MDAVETAVLAFVQDAYEIDDMGRLAEGSLDRRTVVTFELHRHDLADLAEWPQMAGAIRVSRGNADRRTLLCQSLDDLTANEPRAAENRDGRVLHPASETLARLRYPP